MSPITPDERADRLYRLLPIIYRMRDAGQGYPLQALLQVITGQVNVVEDHIDQLYRDWFIETSEDWAVPYLGDLIGYHPVLATGEAARAGTPEGRLLRRVLVPRREVANTIRYRRRRGTLAVLELLARDIADWPARAMEFFKLLGWNQNIDHLHLDRARTVDLRKVEALDRLNGPFDSLAHSVDVRRIDSARSVGRYNIPSVGAFVWRLRSYSVTDTPAYCAEDEGPHCFTFSVLGQDAPLFINPEPEADESGVAGELNVPARIRRLAFAKHTESYYGPDRSLSIHTDGWGGFGSDQPLPMAAMIPADLSNWSYVPPLDHVAVDPVLGRFAFPPSQLPRKGVRVTYHYGFSADLGGGEYVRAIRDPSLRPPGSVSPDQPGSVVPEAAKLKVYTVGRGDRIGDVLKQWQADAPETAVIELAASAVYVEPVNITLGERQTLQVRATNRTRPIIRVLDWQTDLPDAVSVTMARGSRLSLDGLLVTGRPIRITGPARESPADPLQPACGAEVVIRHCTLVPGWGIDCDCQPKRPGEPSLELSNVRARVRIHASMLGPIQIHEDEVTADPIPLCITDSIVDATDAEREAIGGPGTGVAHTLLSIRRSTVYGLVEVHAIELAENSIFNDCVNVARRQLGCMRFCYVPSGCRTPRRYHCQPDLVEQAVRDRLPAGGLRDAAVGGERLRVRPQFTSVRYGHPAYAQLGRTCADEIRRGADDESEMGAFHDLFQPQREANLRGRLEEYTPAGMDVGIRFVT